MRADAEARVQVIALRQHSAIGRSQALEAGVSRKTIDRYLRNGLWTRLYPGAYIVGPVKVTWRQRQMCAQLACGPQAIGSHRGAAPVWDFGADLFVPEVRIPYASRRAPDGIVVHRSKELEYAVKDGFRVTRPMRTIVDLASVLPSLELAQVVDAAHRQGLIRPAELAEYLSLPSNQRLPGTGTLRGILRDRSDEPNDSTLETVFFEALRTCRVPLPATQHPVMTRGGQKYIDYAYPDHMIAIELDSWEHHGSRIAFERDRPRRNEIELLGWHVLQFTWRALRDDPIGVAITMGRALGLLPSRWRKA